MADLRHAPLKFVPGAAVPLGYGVLIGGQGWQAARTASDAPHPAGVGETFVWTGPWHEDAAPAISDAWIHATGSLPVER